jgi:regulatory protein
MLITKIKSNSKLTFRSDIFVDGHFGFTLNNRTLIKIGLKEEDEISSQKLTDLQNLDLEEQAYHYGLQMLGRRNYTAKDFAQRLGIRFPKATVQATTSKFKQQQLLDDEKFTKEFIELANSRMYSPRKIQAELNKRGVPSEIIQTSLSNLSPDNTLADAYQIASKKNRQLDASDPQSKAKLLAYLARRGFDYSTAKRAIEQVLKSVDTE